MAELPPIAPGYEPEDPPVEDVSGCLSNRCVLDKSTLNEALRTAMDTPFFRVLRILEPCLMAVTLGLLIWAAVKGLGATPILFYSLLLTALVYFYLQQFVLYPRRAVKNQILRQALNDGATAPENLLYFKAENIANRRGDAQELLHMPYEKIKRVTESRRLIVLTTRSKNLIPLDKSGFACGTAEDLWQLLAEKCPKADLRRRSQPPNSAGPLFRHSNCN